MCVSYVCKIPFRQPIFFVPHARRSVIQPAGVQCRAAEQDLLFLWVDNALCIWGNYSSGVTESFGSQVEVLSSCIIRAGVSPIPFPWIRNFVVKRVLQVPVTVHREHGVKREKNQQDATIRCLLSTSVSTCFGHYYAHLQKNKDRVTAYGVLRWFCWMLLVAVVGHCVVGCEPCEGHCSTVTVEQ